MDSTITNTVNVRNKNSVRLWRHNSLFNLRRLNSFNSSVFESSSGLTKSGRNWNTVVTIVLVEARSLPTVPDDGVTHNVYCKFRLGSETYRSKSAHNSQRPQWKERFQMHLYKDTVLQISLRDKGRMKNSMGGCILDLSSYEKERTHEIWLQLDDGYGEIHLSVTMCEIRSIESPIESSPETSYCSEKHAMLKIPSDWCVVGILHVAVFSAKGFTSKPNAYCTLEIDNQRVETQRAGACSDPKWNKCYVFKVYDVTSSLDLKVYDSSITNALLNDSIGKVSIPLLRITNDVTRWYALKDKGKRNSAKGNCPRILLKMSMVWNPLKATTKLFQPKQTKYIKKMGKFDIALIYGNMLFVSDLLNLAVAVNDYYTRLFEWDDKEFSLLVVVGWIVFCLYLKLWAVPLLLILPFFYHWVRSFQENSTSSPDYIKEDLFDYRVDKSFTGKLQDLQKMTFTIKNGIEYMSSLVQRLFNLVTFKVPFLSYVSIIILILASVGLYFIPFNYFLMSLGIYKFTRKQLNPDRILNNDLLDFLMRVPDNEILKDWKELGVPEPNQENQVHTNKITRSVSTSI